LLRFSGSGFFNHRFYSVKVPSTRHALAADNAIIGEQAFTCRLHRRNSTRFHFSYLYELLDAAFTAAIHIEMVAHEVQKGILSYKIPGAVHSVPITQRRWLVNEKESPSVMPNHFAKRDLVTGLYYHTDLFYPCSENFFKDDVEEWFFYPIPVDKDLQRQVALPLARSSDNGFGYLHRLPPSLTHRRF
jgi:hypothetical protein